MKNKHDNRELEYYNYLLNKNIDDDPEYLDNLKMLVISKKICQMYEEDNELHLYNFKTSIPRFHIEHMSVLIRKYNDNYISKYGLYRMCENYLTKTDWFQKLDEKTRYVISIDFYKSIILEIHKTLKLIEAYKKYESNNEN